jgi:DNA (cytosine-5)-methyltransferase 1
VPINYDPLWKLLIDKKMTKTELRIEANISTSALAKMGKGESVSLEVLERVCLILGCQLSDVAVITQDMKK